MPDCPSSSEADAAGREVGYLLLVRFRADLERACREVSEFFSFQSRQPSPMNHELLGVWIEPNALLHVPFRLASPSRGSLDSAILVGETFGIAGIWELARLYLPATLAPAGDLRGLLIESLCAPGEQRAPGLFAPVFAGPAIGEAVYNKLARLRHRYPAVPAVPLVQDSRAGALICPDFRALIGAPMRTDG